MTKTASRSTKDLQLPARMKTGDGPKSGFPMRRGISMRSACRIKGKTRAAESSVRLVLGAAWDFHLREGGTSIVRGKHLSCPLINDHGIWVLTGGEGPDHAVVLTVDGRNAVAVCIRDIDYVPLRIHSHCLWMFANRERRNCPFGAKIDEAQRLVAEIDGIDY